MKIVINKCYGGFHLSNKAKNKLAKAVGVKAADLWTKDYREHPALVAIVEEMGVKAYDASVSELAIVEIPDTATDWELSEYDGFEEVIYVLNGKIHHA